MSTDNQIPAVIVNWWLAEVSPYGYAMSLDDGPHDDREGVEQSAYLIERLGLTRGRKFCCVRVEQFEVTPKAHDTNQEALKDCQKMMRR